MSNISYNESKITLSTVCLVLLALFASIFVARELRAILIPFFIALFLSLLFQPGIAKASKYGIPKIISILFYLAITAVFIIFLTRFFFDSLKQFTLSFNSFIPRVTAIVNEVYEMLDLSPSMREDLSIGSILSQYVGVISSTLFSFTNRSINFASQSFLVLLFTVFLLLEFRNFSYKFSTAFSSSIGERLNEVGPAITIQISHYLAVKTFVSALTGVSIFLSLHFIGVNFAAMWGMVGFILNFIPVVGSAVVVILTILMSLIQFYPEPGPIIATIISMSLIQAVLGQILDPRMQGKSLDVSPFLILLSLALWGWIWGIPGMFLSVPITVGLKIIMANFGPFKAIAVLMSVGTPPTHYEGGDKPIKCSFKKKLIPLKNLFTRQKNAKK